MPPLRLSRMRVIRRQSLVRLPSAIGPGLLPPIVGHDIVVQGGQT